MREAAPGEGGNTKALPQTEKAETVCYDAMNGLDESLFTGVPQRSDRYPARYRTNSGSSGSLGI
jgi:hypothetical protein